MGELRALTRLAFDELGSAPGGIGAVHDAIARRVFRATGSSAAPVAAAHDAIAAASYAAVRAGFGAAGIAAGLAVRSRDTALSASPRGAAVVAAVQGLRGDELERAGSPLHAPMAIRVGGAPVPPDRDALRTAFPAATQRIVVFLHGLMETEHAWWWRADRAGGTYGSRLAAEHGYTPVFIRYNTGCAIAQNGRALDELLDALVAQWPVEVERLALVGHSMGGLVARSAGHAASEREARWLAPLTHMISLGTPHLGAPLEQAVSALGAALDAVPETEPFGGFLRRRSAGIRDLRHGLDVPLLPGVTHCCVTATVTRHKGHPVGRAVGDLLVLEGSGAGRTRRRRIGFREEDGLHIGGANHFALLNHPDVDAQLRRWLA